MNKYMSNGWRTPGTHILTEKEIMQIKKEINAIDADMSIFVFNDENHINTCYNDEKDIIYIRGDILPDTRYASKNILYGNYSQEMEDYNGPEQD